MRDKLNLLVLSSRFPYPIERGDKLRLYYQLLDLKKTFNIHLISLTDEEISKEDLQHINQMCNSINIYTLSKSASYISVFRNLIFGNLPSQTQYFSRNSLRRKITKEIALKKIDLAYIQLVRMGEYIPNHIPSVLDLMDAFSFGAQIKSKNKNPFIKYFWTQENNRLKAYEKNISNKVNKLTIISELDKSRMEYLEKDLIVVNNGIGQKFINNTETFDKSFDIGFVGNLSYYPNIEAVKYIYKYITPSYFKKYNINLTCNIIGPNSQKLGIPQSNFFKISGWYDNVVEAYKSMKVFCAPIYKGMGQQNKILEALALRIPCVCSSPVANALNLKHDKHVLIADNPQDYCHSISTFLNNSNKASEISNNGYNFVKEYHDWKTVNNKLTNLLLATYEKI